ncbi:MAG: hypothetical protein Q7R64_01165 [bacterium]|nr:hypothetical protein [bacterium]
MEGLMALFVLSMFFYAGFGTFLCWLRDDWNAKNLTTIIGCAVLGVLLLFAFFGPMIFSSGRKANDREEDK